MPNDNDLSIGTLCVLGENIFVSLGTETEDGDHDYVLADNSTSFTLAGIEQIGWEKTFTPK